MVVISDSYIELTSFYLSKTLRCGKQMRIHKEMSWLTLQNRENKDVIFYEYNNEAKKIKKRFTNEKSNYLPKVVDII